MLPLIDSHCHLDFEVFDADRAHVISQCKAIGIEYIIVPGTTQKTWSKLLSTCEQYPMLRPALGLHPMFMSQHQPADITALELALTQMTPVAIGEIGLDFYDSKKESEIQISLFQSQLKLARKYDLPVILHVRKAHDEVLKQLRMVNVTGGIVHAFSGSEQQAEQYLKLGFKLGVGGALTYDRAKKLHRLFSQLPLNAIVLETDAPDMPMMGKQGQRNSPEIIPNVLAKLAELRHESIETLAAATTDNCKHLFKLT